MTFAGRHFHDFRDFFPPWTTLIWEFAKVFSREIRESSYSQKFMLKVYAIVFFFWQGLILPKLGVIYRALSELFFLKRNIFSTSSMPT